MTATPGTPFSFWSAEDARRAQLQGWLLTNDSDGCVTISRIDDPPAWTDPPLPYTVPVFASDAEAWNFVVHAAGADLNPATHRTALLAVWLTGRPVEQQLQDPPPAALCPAMAIPTKGTCPTLAKCHPDEPIFVLRAQDELAPHTIRDWVERAGYRGVAESKLQHAAQIAKAMEQWPRRKLPD